MNTTLSHNVCAQRFSVIREMGMRAARYDNVIPLSIGEPDFNTPRFVCEAMGNAARAGVTHYAASGGDPLLVAALVEHIRTRLGLDIGPANILVGTGAMHALFAAMHTLLNPGDEVIALAPCFSDYAGQAGLAGGRLVTIPTRLEDGFLPTDEALEAAISPRSRVLLLNSPSNPAGVVLGPDLLDRLAAFAIAHDLMVVSDEVYDSLIWNGQIDSIARRPGMAERTIVLNSFSKAYAMTGLRVGYACGPEWFMREMIKVFSYSVASTNSIAQRGALAALQGPQDEFISMREAFGKRVAYAHARLAAMPGVQCPRPGGAFYLFPRFDAAMDDTMAFALEILDKARVVTVPGFPFGDPETVRGCLRIACTVDETRLAEAMDRIESFLGGYTHA